MKKTSGYLAGAAIAVAVAASACGSASPSHTAASTASPQPTMDAYQLCGFKSARVSEELMSGTPIDQVVNQWGAQNPYFRIGLYGYQIFYDNYQSSGQTVAAKEGVNGIAQGCQNFYPPQSGDTLPVQGGDGFNLNGSPPTP